MDTEYYNSNEKDMKVVCITLQAFNGELQEKETYWLLDHDEWTQARSVLYAYACEDFVFCSYNVIAEARALQSAFDFNPMEFTWVDLMLEVKQWYNWNYRSTASTGEHYLKTPSGTYLKKVLLPPVRKWERVESSADTGCYAKPQFGLESSLFKFTGLIPNGHKKAMINLILRGEPYTEEEKKSIIEYCESDVHLLHKMHKKLLLLFGGALKFGSNRTNRPKYWEGAYNRGEWSAMSAIIERNGYPVNEEALRNFSGSIVEILGDAQKDLLEKYPDVNPFTLNKDGITFKENQKNIKNWIAGRHSLDEWMNTEKGSYSLSLDAFENYKGGTGFGTDYREYKKLKQSLNGFSTDSTKSTIFDSMGSDSRVRYYANIYGSATGRSQPSSTSFIFLKSKWLRSMIQAPKGYAIIACDYVSEEFLIGAILSGDRIMTEAYKEGDPYLYLGKAAGVIPPEGTKKTHPKERSTWKEVTLGVGFLMSKYGLSKRLTANGLEHSDDEAQELIDTYNNTYYKYSEWRQEVIDKYDIEEKLTLPSGWFCFGDNDNHRSVANWMVQGYGSDVLRNACRKSLESGLIPIATLHDAIYFLSPITDIRDNVEYISEAMIEGFKETFVGLEGFQDAGSIRLDFDIWSPDYNGQTIQANDMKIKVDNIYIPEGEEKNYERFKKYFENRFDFL